MDVKGLKNVLRDSLVPTELPDVFVLAREIPCTLNPEVGESGVLYIRALSERTGKVVLGRFTRLEEKILEGRGRKEEDVELQVPADFITGIVA